MDLRGIILSKIKFQLSVIVMVIPLTIAGHNFFKNEKSNFSLWRN